MSQHQLTSLAQLEADLWEAGDQRHANSKLISSEYCMPVLGVIFLRRTYAHEPNHTISRRFQMSLAIAGIEQNIAHGEVRHG
jgi:hypothetical protein